MTILRTFCTSTRLVVSVANMGHACDRDSISRVKNFFHTPLWQILSDCEIPLLSRYHLGCYPPRQHGEAPHVAGLPVATRGRPLQRLGRHPGRRVHAALLLEGELRVGHVDASRQVLVDLRVDGESKCRFVLLKNRKNLCDFFININKSKALHIDFRIADFVCKFYS